MSRRTQTLAAVQASQPAALPLPAVPTFGGAAFVEQFTAVLEGIGGQLVRLPHLG